ncbi:MAG TPA: hypothetical protein VHP11_04300 [Tepidisphaeraceae bacterium]|nr:hypothetical protein [Tepidisphaeraceae bacterium]
MMRWVRSVTLGLLALTLLASQAQAAAFNPKQVPADAKWVLHVDVDAVKESSAGKLLLKELDKREDFQQGITNFQVWAGVKLPEDLHDVTLYGKAFDGSAVVVLIRGTVDPVKITNLLQMVSGYSSTKHGQHEVYAWQDKGKQLYGSLEGSTLVVTRGSQENMAAALDLLDGKGESMKADAAIASGAGVLAYVAADGLSQLKQAKTPLVSQAEAAWLSLREQAEQLVLNAAVTAKTPQFAEQMRVSLEGIKAMVTLAASNENADLKAKAAATVLQTLTAKSQDKTLNLECRISLDLIRNLIQNAQAATPAEPKPAQ